MPQEDGGRVIESWRVTTTARVRTANYSQTCIYLSSGGTVSNKKEETRKYYKYNNRFTASCLVTYMTRGVQAEISYDFNPLAVTTHNKCH